MDRNRTTRRNEFLPLAKFKTYKLKNYNFRLILLMLVICGLGIAIIGSANDGSDNRAVLKQAIGMVIGFSGMIVISLIDYGWILKFYWLIYVFNVGLLSAVLLIGSSHHGAKRWIDITDGLTIQPSEFAKIFMILFLAKFLTVNKERISKWWFLIVTAGLAGITLLLIEKEPDLSTTILVTGLTIIMVFAAGISYKKIGIILAVFIPVAAAAIIYIQQPEQKLLDDYQMKRINAFLYPDEYDDARYQQDNSVLAIGSGKLYGKGLYNDSTESLKNANYLSREMVNDFIFAIIGEEMGFVGSCIVLGVLFLIIAECFLAAIFAPDASGRMLCTGMAALLTLQVFINVGVATELLPNTGIPLPFISTGLSSLISLFGGMGFVLNVSLQRVRQ
ncbi:MAG TPA: rod shape-determining protein RodA [Eubacterium sp.]|jgi:rod shape determining protein RodA|nr:rod shape-determining protein RodA [Eubacterium sp.]HAZ87074.1 rod shape-determining protein RodA [Eubacterium sp.]